MKKIKPRVEENESVVNDIVDRLLVARSVARDEKELLLLYKCAIREAYEKGKLEDNKQVLK